MDEPSSESFCRLVLRAHLGRSVVDRLARDCHGLIWLDQFEADGDQPFEKVWVLPPNDTTSLHYIEDDFIDKKYLVIKGEEVQKVAECFRGANAVIGIDEGLELFGEADDLTEREDALLTLCLSARPSDKQRLVPVLEKGLRSDERSLRESALTGISYLGWSSLVGLLDRVAREDDDQELRSLARDLADFIGQTA